MATIVMKQWKIINRRIEFGSVRRLHENWSIKRSNTTPSEAERLNDP